MGMVKESNGLIILCMFYFSITANGRMTSCMGGVHSHWKMVSLFKLNSNRIESALEG